MKKKLFYLCSLSLLLCTSCTENTMMEEATLNDSKEILNYGKSKEQYFEDFAGILSKLTYNNQEVREFLKREA